MNDAIVKIAIAVMPFMAGALGYIYRGRLLNAKANGSELQNARQVIEMWKELIAEREQTINLLHQKAEKQEKKIESLEDCKRWLESELETVIAENRRLKEELSKSNQ